MRLARHAVCLAASVLRQAVRSGNWWLPVVILLLAMAAVVVATANVVVPTSVYVLF